MSGARFIFGFTGVFAIYNITYIILVHTHHICIYIYIRYAYICMHPLKHTHTQTHTYPGTPCVGFVFAARMEVSALHPAAAPGTSFAVLMWCPLCGLTRGKWSLVGGEWVKCWEILEDLTGQTTQDGIQLFNMGLQHGSWFSKDWTRTGIQSDLPSYTYFRSFLLAVW